jgi:ammonia channel protein AmtB
MGDPMSVCVGLFIVWWGWIGFNAGSSYGITGGKWEFAARAGAGTTLASMSAGMTSILFSLLRHKGKVDVFEVISGVLSGLGEQTRSAEKLSVINTSINNSRHQLRMLHVLDVFSCDCWFHFCNFMHDCWADN